MTPESYVWIVAIVLTLAMFIASIKERRRDKR